jgi:carboxyl-terminal processing protease
MKLGSGVILKKIGLVFLSLVLTVCLLSISGCWLFEPLPTAAPPTPTVDPGTDDDLHRVNEAWSIILENYVGRDDVDTKAMSEAAIRAMIESIEDTYGAYLDAEQREISLGSTAGKLSGIGASVSNRDGKIIIVSPHPGLPAEAAGILPGDELIAVDGRLVNEMTYTETILNVRGPVGTEVVLTILHPGETETVEIAVVRAEFDIPSVNWEMKTETIAYIRIISFTQRTSEELSDVLAEIRRSDAESIILDMQNNPGGTVTAVVESASQFYRDGIVLIVEDTDGTRTEIPTVSGFRATDLPMLVLVNEYSASGSEVLAGFLQHYDRAVVAGNTTFGKGSVNRLYPMRDGGGLYVSVSRWLTPGLKHIEGQGIEPDIRLDVSHAAAVDWAVDYLSRPRP